MATCETEGEQSTGRCRPLPSRRVSADHRDFDFAGFAESGARNFRSTELEDGVERKRRAVSSRRCDVGWFTGWASRRQTAAVVSVDRHYGLTTKFTKSTKEMHSNG